MNCSIASNSNAVDFGQTEPGGVCRVSAITSEASKARTSTERFVPKKHGFTGNGRTSTTAAKKESVALMPPTSQPLTNSGLLDMASMLAPEFRKTLFLSE
jgi:hypothetical protein